MSSDIKAKSNYRKGSFSHVTADVTVPLTVSVDLFEDGTYTVRAKGEHVQFEVDTIEKAIDGAFEAEDLEAAYEAALEVDFGG
jgi:hypothetical protein